VLEGYARRSRVEELVDAVTAFVKAASQVGRDRQIIVDIAHLTHRDSVAILDEHPNREHQRPHGLVVWAVSADGHRATISVLFPGERRGYGAAENSLDKPRVEQHAGHLIEECDSASLLDAQRHRPRSYGATRSGSMPLGRVGEMADAVCFVSGCRRP
jgi:hypothetical protein